MKRYSIHLSIAALGILAISMLNSCSKDYFDINENPNSPSDASIKELLPSAEAAIALAVGADFQIYGGLWGQYWTQNPSASQYKTFEQYSPSSSDFDRSWKLLYADALQDLVAIEQKSEADGLVNYVAIAKILKAYSFQLLTDNFGDIPFSEALNPSIIFPKYDSQQSVYAGIINLLEEADALIDESGFTPASDDMLLHGDMAVWRKFGNTLRLRAYIRISNVDASTAQAGIASMTTAGAEYLGDGENIQFLYNSIGGNSNPAYSAISELSFIQNLVASATCINYMISKNDPRVDVLYTPPSSGIQSGIPQGSYGLPVGTPYSVPSAFTGADGEDPSSALAPVNLMTGTESLFLQAEAALRGFTADDAEALYNEAVSASFTACGLTNGEDATYLAQTDIAYPASGTDEDKLEAIITQKWLALCGTQNNEGWSEWRRTGYPAIFTESTNSIIGGGRFPARFFYPNTEVTRNQEFPGQKLIFDKVWWDVN